MMSMNELQIFENEEFGSVRTIMVNDEPWFVATDICKALELSNTTVAIGRLDDDERSKFNLGRQGETNCVNEYGLYSLVLSSRKQSANKFKRWITHEVIPEIRKTGGYQMPQTYAEALRALADKAEEAERLQIENERMKPKEVFADAVTASDNAILVREFAKMMRQNGIDIGEKRLYKWLRANGYVCKDGTEPTQRAMEHGLFEVLERTVLKGDVPPKTVRTTKITGKGQVFFANKLLNREHANKE